MRSALLLLMLSLVWTAAAFDADWQAGLPPVVAVIDGREVTRAEALALLRRSVGDKVLRRGDYQSALKQALEEEFCRIALRKRLAANGIVPSRELAMEFLVAAAKLRPAGMPAATPFELNQLAGDPEMQLRIALQVYLAKTFPARLLIRDDEVEDFYRNEQERFLRPASVRAGILRMAKTPENRKALERAAAYLRQGGGFEKAIAMCSPALPPEGIPVEILSRTAGALKPQEVSDIVELPDSWMLIQLWEHIPESYWPLESVREYIRQELAGRRAGEELAREVAATLGTMKIEYKGVLAE